MVSKIKFPSPKRNTYNIFFALPFILFVRQMQTRAVGNEMKKITCHCDERASERQRTENMYSHKNVCNGFQHGQW